MPLSRHCLSWEPLTGLHSLTLSPHFQLLTSCQSAFSPHTLRNRAAMTVTTAQARRPGFPGPLWELAWLGTSKLAGYIFSFFCLLPLTIFLNAISVSLSCTLNKFGGGLQFPWVQPSDPLTISVYGSSLGNPYGLIYKTHAELHSCPHFSPNLSIRPTPCWTYPPGCPPGILTSNIPETKSIVPPAAPFLHSSPGPAPPLSGAT